MTIQSSTQIGDVIRNAVVIQIPSEEIVVDDLLMLEEGEVVAADGGILTANDFFLNESILILGGREWIQFLTRPDRRMLERIRKAALPVLVEARPYSVKASSQFRIQHALFRCVSMIGVSISSG